jgi:hypothetical protein
LEESARSEVFFLSKNYDPKFELAVATVWRESNASIVYNRLYSQVPRLLHGAETGSLTSHQALTGRFCIAVTTRYSNFAMSTQHYLVLRHACVTGRSGHVFPGHKIVQLCSCRAAAISSYAFCEGRVLTALCRPMQQPPSLSGRSTCERHKVKSSYSHNFRFGESNPGLRSVLETLNF